VKGELERLADWLERRVEDEARGAFSDEVVNEFLDPVNFERLFETDAKAVFTGPCGDTMEIYLLVDGATIDHASFMTDGCGATVACGSRLTRLVKGMRLEDARRLEPQWLRDALGGLPEDHTHCADLAILTLRKAIDALNP
jgi:nitrogen fixation NifU-like protein